MSSLGKKFSQVINSLLFTNFVLHNKITNILFNKSKIKVFIINKNYFNESQKIKQGFYFN